MIYAYSSSPERLEVIKNVATKIGQNFKMISQSQLNDPVAQITGGMKVPCKSRKAPPLYILPEIIIFAGLKDKELDKFYDTYKLTNQTSVRLKAVVTPYNMSWSLYELVEELKKEAASLGH